jgi:hypothetical protein
MGTWGTAIFSDDTAADTRDAFSNFIGEGLTPAEATDRLIAESAEILADEDDGNVFWLALSLAQWKLGRLLDNVRDRAIAVIDSGMDLRRWQDNRKVEINQRKKHLAKLREQLLSPQPKPKKIKPFAKSSTGLKAGDVAAFRLNEAVAVRFFVYEIWGDRGGTYANICLLGLEEGQPVSTAKLEYSDLLGPHCSMLSHEPPESITILRRGVPMPEVRDIGRAWTDQTVHGFACTWEQFASKLPSFLAKLGWQGITKS